MFWIIYLFILFQLSMQCYIHFPCCFHYNDVIILCILLWSLLWSTSRWPCCISEICTFYICIGGKDAPDCFYLSLPSIILAHLRFKLRWYEDMLRDVGDVSSLQWYSEIKIRFPSRTLGPDFPYCRPNSSGVLKHLSYHWK